MPETVTFKTHLCCGDRVLFEGTPDQHPVRGELLPCEKHGDGQHVLGYEVVK